MAHRLSASTVAGLCGALVLLAPAPAYADSVRDQQWSLDLLGAEAAWEHSRGDGVTVAVLDSGVDADHPDLDGQVLAGRDVVSETDDASDVHGHGTAVAAIIAGHDDDSGVVGLAPEASILPVRVGGERMSETDVAEGIRWAVDHGADVVNMSLGSPHGQESVADAVAYAIAKDVVVVAAAGNISEPGDPRTIGYPARLPGVVAVTGTDRMDRQWSSSTRGPRAALSAPATGVAAPVKGEYKAVSGTSFAAPMVAAGAALIRSRWPDLSAANVINRLLRTAKDLGRPGRDSRYGFGRLDLAKALTAEVPEISANPLLYAPEQQLEQPELAGAGDEQKEQPGGGAAHRWVGLALIALCLAGLAGISLLLAAHYARQVAAARVPRPAPVTAYR